MRAEFLEQIDRDRLPRLAAGLWNATAVEHVQDSESSVYRTEIDGRTAFLRLTHDGHRPRGQIEAELDFIRHLAAHGGSVAEPIAAEDGAFIHSLDVGAATVHATVFAGAPGDRLDLRSVADNADAIRSWGNVLGTIHAAAAGYRPKGGRRFRWDEDDVWTNADAYLPPSETDARHELRIVQDWLDRRVADDANFGLIHGDLCLANLHASGGTLTAFDFDDSAYHWFLYDIVCAIAPNVVRPAPDRAAIRVAFLDGYTAAHPLPDDWEPAFDMFLRARGLYLFVLNHRHWTGDPAAHPKRGFLGLLRETFKQPLNW